MKNGYVWDTFGIRLGYRRQKCPNYYKQKKEETLQTIEFTGFLAIDATGFEPTTSTTQTYDRGISMCYVIFLKIL